jgi:molybdenum cofactor guanylyltransferase
MNAMILAGGENRRIGFQKCLAEVEGMRIIEKNLKKFEKYFKIIFISTNNPETFFYLGRPLTGDILNHCGPMTGIFSVLVSSGSSEIFVSACDMPFIDEKVIGLIRDRYNGQDALIPVFNKRPQPLLGIYSAKAADLMEKKIRLRDCGMTAFLDEINTVYIDEEDIAKVDPSGRSFVNINTMEDYEKFKLTINNDQ